MIIPKFSQQSIYNFNCKLKYISNHGKLCRVGYHSTQLGAYGHNTAADRPSGMELYKSMKADHKGENVYRDSYICGCACSFIT